MLTSICLFYCKYKITTLVKLIMPHIIDNILQTLDTKASNLVATPISNGLLSSIDKLKLDTFSAPIIYQNDFSYASPEWGVYGTPVSYGIVSGALNCDYNGTFDGVQMTLSSYPQNTTILVTYTITMTAGTSVSIGLLQGSWSSTIDTKTVSGTYTTKIVTNATSTTANHALAFINFGTGVSGSGSFTIDNIVISGGQTASYAQGRKADQLQSANQRFGIVDYQNAGSVTSHFIQTTIPYGSNQMVHLNIKGYIYQSSDHYNIGLSFYTYASATPSIVNSRYTVTGSAKPLTINMAYVNGFLAIELVWPTSYYFHRFVIDSFCNSGGTLPVHYQNWTVTPDVAIPLSSTGYMSPPYTSTIQKELFIDNKVVGDSAGSSLFVKSLSSSIQNVASDMMIRAYNKGYTVITVDQEFYNSEFKKFIHDDLKNISAVIFFDEFEKQYAMGSDDVLAGLLSIFQGSITSHKLFICTANNRNNIDDAFLIELVDSVIWWNLRTFQKMSLWNM